MDLTRDGDGGPRSTAIPMGCPLQLGPAGAMPPAPPAHGHVHAAAAHSDCRHGQRRAGCADIGVSSLYTYAHTRAHAPKASADAHICAGSGHRREPRGGLAAMHNINADIDAHAHVCHGMRIQPMCVHGPIVGANWLKMRTLVALFTFELGPPHIDW